MDIRFVLCLPRDAASVPVVRHLCRDALLRLGVTEGCVSDIEVVVTEACSNVLNHARGTSEQYEVGLEVSNTTCRIRVIDAGGGFDHQGRGREVSVGSAESGRGIFLMRALVDELEFVSVPNNGTEVHLVKKLSLEPDAFLDSLSLGSPSSV